MQRDVANLSNWREIPHSRWAFHHVRELIPTANIAAGGNSAPLSSKSQDLDYLRFEGLNGERCPLKEDVLIASETDAFIVLHRGYIVFEWYADHYNQTKPHILFSVSKSITGLLMGILADQEIIDPNLDVTHYLSEAADTGYDDCTVQQVLDMTAGIDFEESYLDTDGQFAKYRAATGWNPPVPDRTDAGLHEFLLSLKRNDIPHGHTFQYLSPNSDLLGWILERATNQPLAELFSRYLWQPMGAETDAYITVDHHGAARSVGGVCTTLHDLACVGELMRLCGKANGRQVVSIDWINDTLNNGDPAAWQRGSFASLLPNGRYRNQWYQTGNDHGAFCAIGIHGQWLYVDPVAALTIVKLSSQALPLDEKLDLVCLKMFDQMASMFE